MFFIKLGIIFIISFLSLKFFVKKRNFFKLILLEDKDFKKIQSFHKTPVLNIGGIFIFLLLGFSNLIFFNTQLLKVFLFSSPIFLFSFLEDLKVKINPLLRLFITFLILLTCVYFSNLNIYSIQIYSIDNLLKNYEFINIIFLTFCIVFIVNGSNFIDGFNGLLGLHFLIILVILTIINIYIKNWDFVEVCLIISVLNIVFVIFNFPNAKIFYGNAGSYLVGFIISYLVISTNQYSQYHKIYPFFFACLMYYLFFEVFFSFFRKFFFENKNPFLPDKKHLHMIFFKRIKSNFKTGFFINIYYLFSLLPIIFFINRPGFVKFYFFLLLVFYLIFYIYQRNLLKKN